MTYSATIWTYVKFPDFENQQYHTGHVALQEYRTWLTINAGEEIDHWFWNRGDRFAKGVNIKDPQVATMFKLIYGYNS